MKIMQLREHLKSYNIFIEKEIEEVFYMGSYKTYKKADFIIKEGDVCKNIGFIVSGIIRSYYYTSQGKDITYCLSFPESFVSAHSSYISQKESTINIQALTDAELFIIPKEAMDKLINTNTNWLKFSKVVTERYYMALENRVFELQREKAEIRYLNLIKNRPKYIKKIPLQYLASYLGITQRHLSRLRANISF